jgi:hypothetical protein
VPSMSARTSNWNAIGQFTIGSATSSSRPEGGHEGDGIELRKNILVAGILPASLLMDGGGRHAGQCLRAVEPAGSLADAERLRKSTCGSC